MEENSNKPQASGFDFLRAAADQATKEGAYTAGEARNVLNVIDFLENSETRLKAEIKKLQGEVEQYKDPTTVEDPTPGRDIMQKPEKKEKAPK